ncbi:MULTISPECIES: hypothetical protein [Sphingomonas]|uniref:Uncharacterized protein n=1 Tax=Sphingomonas kyeonggiensis TaxID=1268553 RepID=A0A7W7K2S9_9SPHN|nr:MULTISPECIES: hypothetical protein [Sphingomonas]MBB4839533.1 hypothetical protein [Sphingomonas kyeonggiensis]WHU03254.1 hypothetical protein O3305_01165 [Sphingomonas sp. NIBR02145]
MSWFADILIQEIASWFGDLGRKRRDMAPDPDFRSRHKRMKRSPRRAEKVGK